MYPSLAASEVHIQGFGGDTIAGYFARPAEPGSYPSVVLLHHLLGLDEATMDIVRRIGAHGYLVLCPNLHYRESKGRTVEEAAAESRSSGGVPDRRMLGDAEAATQWLRGLPDSNGKVGVLGYCSGGRQAFIAACSLDIDAAVDCYGSFVVDSPPPTSPLKITPVLSMAETMRCPLLGLFGADDPNPSPVHVQQMDEALQSLGKEHEFHVYDQAGHGFFDTGRSNFKPETARKAWVDLFTFLGKYLND